MPEHDQFWRALAAHQRRLRIASTASALMVGAVSAAIVGVASNLAGGRAGGIRALAVMSVTLAAGLAAWWWRRWTPRLVAATIEARAGGLDNVIVTAEEVLNRRSAGLHPVVHKALFDEAMRRLRSISTASVQPLRAALSLAALTSAAAAIAIITLQPSLTSIHQAAALPNMPTELLATGDLRVVVTPPGYTGQAATSALNPCEIVVVEGSHVRLETTREGGRLQLSEVGGEPMPFILANNRWSHEFSALQSRILLIQAVAAGESSGDRLLQVRVTPDQRPLVQIRVPAKDLVFGEPRGQVPIELDARDDFGLGSLALRYTRVAGSGETFTFTEGELPLRIERSSATDWQARAVLTLEAFALEDGDALVYRAVATDRKPGADPSASDVFLIEIGRLAGAASTGFAVPEERDRQAISQQMLIIKTERLDAARSSLSQNEYEEQSRLLAIEQRMVKAEFIFMTGGEVADEVAEAEHAHEVVEGRFENAAQVELLSAIREMSRAEARLNAGDTSQALPFERAALRALQRAFDRRRYLLRTLPERTRIDLTRRLTGEQSGTRALSRALLEPPADDVVANARKVMFDLGRALAGREGLNAALAARVVALDPNSEALQAYATTIASSRDLEARLRAASEAQHHLSDLVTARLPARPQERIVDDPLGGRFADEIARRRGRP